ncbi:MAG: hypothetical protein WAW92_00310 [Minisyncoccia bacterium]
MEKNIAQSASPMTTGQIEEIISILRSELQCSAGEFDSEQVQRGLDHIKWYVGRPMLTTLRSELEMGSGTFTRKVRINRNNNPNELLKDTSCHQIVEAEVLQSMPRAEGDDEEVEVVFFNTDRSADLENDSAFEAIAKEYDKRGLKTVDPYTLAEANKWNTLHTLLIRTNHETFWRDAEGNWCVMAFEHGARYHKVYVRRSKIPVWTARWYAGVKK